MAFPAFSRWARGCAPLATLACILSLAVGGCSSSDTARREPHSEAPQPELTGQARFFGGLVTADARLSAFSIHPGFPPGAGRDPASGDDSRPPRSGDHGGMGGGHGGMGGGHGGHHHRSDEANSAPSDTAFAPPPRASWPRQTLHLRFTNSGTEPLTLTVRQLDSALGNFVPQPEQLTLAPGGSADLDPVSGDAGGNVDQLDLTVSLRRDKISDTEVIRLAAPASAP